MNAAVPWEDPDGRFFDRLWTTVHRASVDPVNTFARFGQVSEPRDLAAGVRFAIIVSVIGWLPLLLLTPCLMVIPFAFAASLPDQVRDLGLGIVCLLILATPFVFIFGSVGVELLYGVIFHLTARLVGGVGDARASFHAMLYTSAIRFWGLPAFFLGGVPFAGAMLGMLVRLAFVIWGGFACYGAARSIHKLDDNHAAIVAIVTCLLSMGIVSFVIVGVVFGIVFAIAGSLSLTDLLGAMPR